MLSALNRIFLLLLILSAVSAILFSILILALPALVGQGLELKELEDASKSGALSLQLGDAAPSISPDYSPYLANLTLVTPPLSESDVLSVLVFSGGKKIADFDCLSDYESYSDYYGQTVFSCLVPIPYDYSSSADYEIFGSLSGDGGELVSEPRSVHADWTPYEGNFWGFSWILAIFGLGIYLVVLLPLTLVVLGIASKMKHGGADPKEYSFGSLLNPLSVGKTFFEKANAFFISPYFWALELLGIFIILFYMALSAEIWKSGTAFVAFIFSGLMALVIPYLWCLAFWYADFKEREPLRILVTFFLWGMLAALMAIGINSIAGELLSLVGLGFLGTFLLAPPLEEFYKGSGLGLLSTHHEFDSVEDGVVFGFVIGMGFSFIEDWLYMLNNPMGSDIWGWLGLFFMRSILFSANHGLYTAITGGVIGFVIERGFKAPALGMLVAVPIAAFFHAMHNSGEMLIALLGGGGALVYCCLLIPLFDYGGLALLIALFVYAVFRKKRASSPDRIRGSGYLPTRVDGLG